MDEVIRLERHWVTRYTSGGSIYRVWERIMPRIPDCIADCSIFLYQSEQLAARADKAGGSGFLIHVPSSVPDHGHFYAVTNRHLVDPQWEGDCQAIRINRRMGKPACMPAKTENWFWHDDADVAILPFDPQEGMKCWSVSTDLFLSKEGIEAYHVGYGDDIFLVGRLTSQSGVNKNTPVARFGTIALMSDESEKIKGTRRDQEGFIIECHSISGFSGSPVFLMSDRFYRGDDAAKVVEFRNRNALAYRHPNPQSQGTVIKPVATDMTVGPFLLGIDFGHIYTPADIYLKDGKTKSESKVKINTGMAGVVPNWKILEVLDHPSLVQERAKEDERLRKEQEKRESESSFILDSSPGEEESSFTQKDFESALRRASRKMPSSKSDSETK